MMNEKLKHILNEYQSITVFSGAGVSTLSGIPDFRSENSLHFENNQNLTPMEILDVRFFNKKNNKSLFWNLIEKLNTLSCQSQPNMCHNFCAELQNKGKLNCVITQNIDNLYEKVVSPEAIDPNKIIHIHGESNKCYCSKCGKIYNLNQLNKNNNGNYISECCNFQIYSDVILYSQNFYLNDTENYLNAIYSSDLIIVMGIGLDIITHRNILQNC